MISPLGKRIGQFLVSKHHFPIKGTNFFEGNTDNGSDRRKYEETYCIRKQRWAQRPMEETLRGPPH